MTWDVVETFAISYAYIGRTRTATGASQPMTTHHADASYDFGDTVTLNGYLLRIDYDDEPLWGRSTRTLGGFFTGKITVSESLDMTYRLEYAKQEESGNNPNKVDIGYQLLDLGFVMGKVTLAAAYEVLEGSEDSGAFATPLATLHKFNGWADKFLETPSDGLVDLHVSLSAKLGRWDLVGVYHDFSADNGGASWGTELDAQILYTAPWKQKIALTAALFEADRWTSDTTKVWLWTSWGF